MYATLVVASMDAKVGQYSIDVIVNSFTNLSKALAAVLLVGYVVGKVAPSAADLLALSCGRIFSHSWTIFT